MNTIELIQQRFDQLEEQNKHSYLSPLRKDALRAFHQMGIPTVRHEEWKYTRIGSVFNKEFDAPIGREITITSADLESLRLPGSSAANEIVFVNGVYSRALSSIRSRDLTVTTLEEASVHPDFNSLVERHLGGSRKYLKDGINALNMAFMHQGVFIFLKRKQVLAEPVYIYHLTDSRAMHVLAQPRSLVYLSEGSQAEIMEAYESLGAQENLTNQVTECVLEQEAVLHYYKIQNDSSAANQVSTTHIHQTGKSHVHTVIITLNGGMVRNNTNIVMDAPHSEAHLYGLYFGSGHTHIDNHTIVDNRKPNCLSNELYKGIMDDDATGVFNGKIFVEQEAQKTNAYQSNKNVLLSENASVNTKPQLEIFADDVKCSHGCTVGRLDDEGLFYLRSRGISEQTAKALLLQAFASDILEQIRPEALRQYVHARIVNRLESEKV